jgi:hypothetical protein
LKDPTELDVNHSSILLGYQLSAPIASRIHSLTGSLLTAPFFSPNHARVSAMSNGYYRVVRDEDLRLRPCGTKIEQNP